MATATLSFSPLAEQADLWAALRCQSVQTLALADSLIAQGVGGWSPRLLVRHRSPRRRRVELKTVPLLPSFVFVPFHYADQAIDLGRSGRVPRSWAFRFNGDRPALPVDQLLAMQMADHRKPVATFKPGETVRFVAGPFQGLIGIILIPKGRDRWLVDVGGARILVPSFLIASTGVKAPPS
jgi:hypothetical protein